MKCKVPAKQLKSAIKTVQAIHSFGSAQKDDRMPFVLRVEKDALFIEAAQLGAYAVYRIPCTVLREGSFGMAAKDLQGWRLQGDVVIDANKGRLSVKAGRSQYMAAEDNGALRDLAEHRGAVADIKPKAKMPTRMLAAAARTATFKSEISHNFDVWIRIAPGFFQYSGLDQVSFGRYRVEDAQVQAREELLFCLGNSFLQEVLKHADGELLLLGANSDSSMVRLKTESLDLFHPTVEKQHIDPELAVQHAKASTQLNFSFTAERTALTKAVNAVAPIGKKAQTSTSNLVVKDGKVFLQSMETGRAARHDIEFDTLRVDDEAERVAPVRHQYLTEFVKAAPSTAPLRVTVWGDKFLHLISEVGDDGLLIDYMGVMQDRT